MQFNFNINEVLKSELSIIDSKSKLGYVPFGANMNNVKLMDSGQKLNYIIDQMGRASALAQDLPAVITSGSKLRHSDHRLYLLKVDDENNGEVVGLLKIGYKTLFIYDNQSRQNELKPLCVLDFYVHESKQRQGYGRKLFDHMLKTENVEPHHIAVDRPSAKFLMFLGKHYQLTDKIPQLNNFVVFVNFFNGRVDTNNNNNQRRHRQAAHTPTPLVQSSPSRQNQSIPSPVNISSSQLSKRRTQSSATQDRVSLHINDLASTKNHIDLESEIQGPPLLSRDGVPASYRALLTLPGSRMSRADVVTPSASRQPHILPRIGPRSPEKPCGVSSMIQDRPGCVVRPRRDYNYTVGLARHYSHTRLW